jgi:hypothetical protein
MNECTLNELAAFVIRRVVDVVLFTGFDCLETECLLPTSSRKSGNGSRLCESTVRRRQYSR